MATKKESAPEAPPSVASLRQPAGSKPAVFLIDTMAFIFRAYHAMARQRPMSTRSGIPTAATFVFVNMINKLRQDYSPQFLAAVYDVSGPTFRDDQAAAVTSVKKFDIKTQQFEEIAYHGYKANRVEMPEDLVQQLPYIQRALEAYRIPIVSQQRFEADDIIGTLARQAAAQDHPVWVVSSDKDMMQLVNDRVWILNPPKDNLICDPAKVEELLGVPPRQVIDVMALRGDAVDNVPGAPGIGDKGSVEIIRRFGTVEAALDHAGEVERKSYRESLLGHRDQVLWSKQLVTIDCNAPIQMDLESMRSQPPDYEASQKLFSELGFTSLLKSVLPTAAEQSESDAGEYAELKSTEQLEALLKKVHNGFLAIAFETESAGSARKAGEEAEEPEDTPAPAITGDLFATAGTANEASKIGLSAEANHGYQVELAGALGKKIQAALEDESLEKAIHDWKAALRHDGGAGVKIAGVKHDVSLYSYLLDPTASNHLLENLAVRRFNRQLTGSLAQAADFTLRLATRLRKEVDDGGLLKLFEEIDLPLVPVLARMEEAGVRIDTGLLEDISSRLGRECGQRTKQIHQLAGTEFNINSPKQLADVLFYKLALPQPVKSGKGKTMSTAVDVLEQLADKHEVPRLVLEYRQLAKLKSTYVDALPALLNPRTGRLHTTFIQTGTATGRLASVNPNLQNIPIRSEQGREIRAAFIADAGNVLLAADYSQIELRLLAHYSEDPLLTQAFREGQDIHELTAREVFAVPPIKEIDAELRRRAKAVNFGIVYGLSAFGLAQQLGIDTKEAKTYIDNYFARYTGVRKFIDDTIEQVRRDGNVRNLFGRMRPIPEINSKNPNMRGFAERTAVNTPLQGTAADLIKVAMIRIDEELRQRELKTRMTLQVHDELVFDVPEKEVEEVRALVKEKMENAYKLLVPLVVDVGVGKNWRDME